MGPWRTDLEQLPKLGWVVEYLLEEEQARVRQLSAGSGLDEAEVLRLVEGMSVNDWFDVTRTGDGDLEIRLSDGEFKSVQKTYLEGVLERIRRPVALARAGTVQGRVWLQMYRTQDVVEDVKSSGTYYRLRLSDRSLRIVGLEKGDCVEIDLERDSFEESAPQYLRLSSTDRPATARTVYEIYDEAPANYDPKITVPAQYRDEFVQGSDDEFRIEVWEEDGRSHIRVYRFDTVSGTADRKDLLYQENYWALCPHEPLLRMFYPGLS